MRTDVCVVFCFIVLVLGITLFIIYITRDYVAASTAQNRPGLRIRTCNPRIECPHLQRTSCIRPVCMREEDNTTVCAKYFEPQGMSCSRVPGWYCDGGECVRRN